jgi:transporter family-2 protein
MIWALLALLAGAMLPIQAGVNAELARIVGHPVRSALVSFAVGTGAFLFLAFALTGPSWPWSRMLQAPWWVYVGGLLGAVYVVGVIALAPRLWALLAFVLVIAGQLLASLAPGPLRSPLPQAPGGPAPPPRGGPPSPRGTPHPEVLG